VGSGIASAFSLLIGFIGMAAAIAFLPGLRGSRLLADFARPDWAKLSEIVRLGLPISLMTILESGFYLALHLVVGLFGAVAVAAHAIAWNVQTLTSPVHTGIGVAASVRVGLAAGANDKARIRRASWTALFATIVCAAPLTAVIALFARPIAGLYLAGPPREVGVIGAAVPFLLVAAAYQVVDGLQGAAVFVLRGLKDVQIPTWIVALCFWGVGSPTCLGLAFTLHLGALGVWLGLAFTLVVTAAMLCARLRRLLR
jgi:MATE family multidrug resistance protein